MTNKSKLRSEIQALKNQAKARGTVITEEQENTEQVKQEQYTPTSGVYLYVYHDLLRTLVFLLLILLFLFAISIKLSTLPQFAHIRTLFHIASFSF